VIRPPDDVTVDHTSASLSRLLGNVTSRGGHLCLVDRLEVVEASSAAPGQAGVVE